MVLPASHGVPRVPWYSGWLCRAAWFSPTGLLPAVAGLSRPLLLTIWFLTRPDIRKYLIKPPQPPVHNGCSLTCTGFGLFPVRSPLLGKSQLLSLPPGTEMFQFPRLAPLCLCVQHRVPELHSGGFPHSGTPGLSVACTYPGLIAAYRALLRLLAPRHPPYALTNLTSSPMDPIAFLYFFSLCSFQRTVEKKTLEHYSSIWLQNLSPLPNT